MSRYARQMQVPGVGAIGQARLTAAHVLIIGAGGLGCTVIPALAAAGVGRRPVIVQCFPTCPRRSTVVPVPGCWGQRWRRLAQSKHRWRYQC